MAKERSWNEEDPLEGTQSRENGIITSSEPTLNYENDLYVGHDTLSRSPNTTEHYEAVSDDTNGHKRSASPPIDERTTKQRYLDQYHTTNNNNAEPEYQYDERAFLRDDLSNFLPGEIKDPDWYTLIGAGKTRVAIAYRPAGSTLEDFTLENKPIPDTHGLYFFSNVREVYYKSIKLSIPAYGKTMLGQLEDGELLAWRLDKVTRAKKGFKPE